MKKKTKEESGTLSTQQQRKLAELKSKKKKNSSLKILPNLKKKWKSRRVNIDS